MNVPATHTDARARRHASADIRPAEVTAVSGANGVASVRHKAFVVQRNGEYALCDLYGFGYSNVQAPKHEASLFVRVHGDGAQVRRALQVVRR
jgi:hypothetical protein